MAQKVLAVAAIRNGTVIDHIPAGQALKIVHLFHWECHQKLVTLGLNLPSRILSFKDIIKIEDLVLSANEANQVAILAPKATVNIIQDFEVISKFQVSIPASIASIISCPNPKCISNHEEMISSFKVKSHQNHVSLECKYCRRIFLYDSLDKKRIL